MTTKAKGLGWKPSLPDARDHHYSIPHFPTLPESADLRDKCPPVYDQGQLGSCTAFAITGAIEYQQKAQGIEDFRLSELFVYYLERAIEHSVRYDAGAMIRDGMKAVNAQGACREQLWPYDIAKFARKPPRKAYNNALLERTLTYARVEQNGIKAVLASEKPVIFGFTVYESFMTSEVARTGVVPMPDFATEKVVGGHAVMAVGYTADTYIFRNSWGTSWGQQGYGMLPCQYVENPNLADDFWVIDLVEGKGEHR